MIRIPCNKNRTQSHNVCVCFRFHLLLFRHANILPSSANKWHVSCIPTAFSTICIEHKYYTMLVWWNTTRAMLLITATISISCVIFSYHQAALWMVQSVHLSVSLSVSLTVYLSVLPFSLCSHHRIIMKFPGVITIHTIQLGRIGPTRITELQWAII